MRLSEYLTLAPGLHCRIKMRVEPLCRLRQVHLHAAHDRRVWRQPVPPRGCASASACKALPGSPMALSCAICMLACKLSGIISPIRFFCQCGFDAWQVATRTPTRSSVTWQRSSALMTTTAWTGTPMCSLPAAATDHDPRHFQVKVP